MLRNVFFEFVFCEGERGFGLRKKIDFFSDVGFGLFLFLVVYFFFGFLGNKRLFRYIFSYFEFGFIYIIFRGFDERFGLKVYKCNLLMERENVIFEKS